MSAREDERLEQLEAIASAAADPRTLLEILLDAPQDQVIPRIAALCRCSAVGARAVLNMQVESLIPGRAQRFRREADALRNHMNSES